MGLLSARGGIILERGPEGRELLVAAGSEILAGFTRRRALLCAGGDATLAGSKRGQAPLGEGGGITFVRFIMFDETRAELGGAKGIDDIGGNGSGLTASLGATTDRGKRQRLARWRSTVAMVAAVMISMVRAVEGEVVALFAD